MGKVYFPPTLVLVQGTNNVLKEFIISRLLSLGYDVNTDLEPLTIKPIYTQQIQKKGFVQSRFVIVGASVNIFLNNGDEVNIVRTDEGDIKTFVDFVIWCWGTSRGGRCPYQSPIIFSPVTRGEWQLL